MSRLSRWAVLGWAVGGLACGSSVVEMTQSEAVSAESHDAEETSLRTVGTHDALFQAAGNEFQIPSALLKALSFAQTRYVAADGSAEFDGQPSRFGLMGLSVAQVEAGAATLGVTAEAVKTDAKTNIRAAAALLSADAVAAKINREQVGAYRSLLAKFSGIQDPDLAQAFVEKGVFGSLVKGVGAPSEDLSAAGQALTLSEYSLTGENLGVAPDYSGAVWRAAPNFSGRNGYSPSMVIIHTCEGGYYGCVDWIASPATQASAHYVVKEDGGEITQMVRENQRAWHISANYNCSLNGGVDCGRSGVPASYFTIGIEHGGHAHSSVWTTGMVDASSRLSCNISAKYGIARDRQHYVGHGQLQPYNRTDPGPNWPWSTYMAKLNSYCTGGGGNVGSPSAPTPAAPPPPPKVYDVLSGDFNGDGKVDLATLSPNGGGGWAQWLAMDLSTPNMGFGSTVWWSSTPGHMRNGGQDSKYISRVGDFNGDGRVDIATLSPNAGGGWSDWAAMNLSTGNSFNHGVWGTVTPKHMRNGGSNADYRVLVGDFNGDGKSDLATLSPNSGGGWSSWYAMELGSATSGFGSTVWGSTTPQHIRNGGNGHRYELLTGDFNGDGKTDIATISPNGGGGWSEWISVDISTGSGFSTQEWRAVTPAHMRNGGSPESYQTLAGDFNGDGKTDLATISAKAGGGWAQWVALELSTGSGFRSVEWGSGTPTHMRNGGADSTYFVRALDLNGDGKTDLATLSPNAGGGWAEWMSVDVSAGSAFSSGTWYSSTPGHMRNGGSNAHYRVVSGDFDGTGRGSVMVLSPNAGGGWADWTAASLSRPNLGGFDNAVWWSATPRHIRNGGY